LAASQIRAARPIVAKRLTTND